MITARWQGVVIAESADTVQLEGNQYFPRNSLRAEHFRDSAHRSFCPWKGEAHYLDVVLAEQTNSAAAWYYPEPKEAAASIRGRVAFWKGVIVD